FDVPALRALRRTLADAGDVGHLQIDFVSVRWLDAAALQLLADDLIGIEARGACVVIRRLPPGVAGRLVHHPLHRFATEREPSADIDDSLFTDPDRDLPGFVPSDR
ncbi:MAG: hypothetical protein ACODAB_07320, partial [Gemmatimonadota bacterium]